ncbi:hypothetical protein [Candidatus Avelusimicrobium luingense]|uniref:hypothetical protein n=1 Tax=Candidatus Avelusimicrobium luingense TaxID=3416211 RepID=UPI003D101CD5
MAKNEKTNKYVAQLKQGFADIQTVAQEGNLKLFLKQFIALLVIFLLFKYLSGKFNSKIQNINGQLEAIRAQQVNEQEYATNKKLLISLEPRFSNVEAKNEWLLSQIIDIFKKAGLTPSVEGAQTENDTNPTYVATSMKVSSTMTYDTFANFLAGIENRPTYIKISDFAIEKDTDPNRIGNNKVSLTLNTIFPKEKIARSLFKDYDQLVAAEQQEKAAAKKRKKGK